MKNELLLLVTIPLRHVNLELGVCRKVKACTIVAFTSTANTGLLVCQAGLPLGVLC